MANRFFTLLTAREAVATATLTSWALAEEIESVDSATRSYTAWIQAVVCETDPTNARSSGLRNLFLHCLRKARRSG